MLSERTKRIRLGHKLAVGVGLIVVIIVVTFAIKSQNADSTVVINSHKINIEIATTSQEKARGLCCRDSLPENSGMLFVYDTPGLYSFWMKDTQVPLDMYWINEDKKIVHIEHNVSPDSYPRQYVSENPAKYILETNAGYARRHGISVGNKVEINL